MKKIVLFFLVAGVCFHATAQDDLMKELEKSQMSDTDYAFQTFKGTRLVNGHTVENKAKNTFEFIFAHRFGAINEGLYEFYGLDDA